ncbi:MAG: YqeG family HAD IIIA-type phosphatase [Acutalibacteraceae bacterium]|jgi:HAD superfamily phosphatase (TIGR01668 family)
MLYPTVRKNRITAVTESDLRAMGVRGVLLDVDNTLTRYKSQELADDVRDWIERMQTAGLSLTIVSNGLPRRVRPFAEKAGLRSIAFACKPSPFGYIRGARRMGLRCKECVIIGDQVFTDVVGANLCGMKSILLQPIELERGKPTIALKRWLEKVVLGWKYKSRSSNDEK